MRTALILLFILVSPAYAPAGTAGYGPEPGTCLLRYLNVQDKYYLLAISDRHERIFDLGDESRIDSLAGCFLLSIQRRQTDRTCGHRLYRAIMPLSLQNCRRLVICADGQLSRVPFECLVPDSADGSLLLLHTAAIQYTDLLRNWLKPGKGYRHAASKRLAIAPDFQNSGTPELTFATGEIGMCDTKAIRSRQFRHLSKQTFLRVAPGNDILHLATHTCSGKAGTGILLSPFDTLFDREVNALQLDAQLLILSACHSSGAFASVFREAGVHNVLSSSWALPDKSSAAIVTSFYRYLGRGLCKSRALQQAKLDYLRKADAEGAEPFYWAGLVLYGDHTEIRLKQPGYRTALWLDGSVCLVAAALFCLGRKYIPKRRRYAG